MDWELVSNTLKLTARGGKDNVWMCSGEVKMKANFSVSISRLELYLVSTILSMLIFVTINRAFFSNSWKE